MYDLYVVVEYCAKHFGKTTSEVSSEVIKSIGFKLNNFTKTEEGKRIINEHKLSFRLPTDSAANSKYQAKSTEQVDIHFSNRLLDKEEQQEED